MLRRSVEFTTHFIQVDTRNYVAIIALLWSPTIIIEVVFVAEIILICQIILHFTALYVVLFGSFVAINTTYS